jgi:hypothetical protein
MEKKYIIGGLAIVGALALFAYLKPTPKKNSEGFFSASGRSGGMISGRVIDGRSSTLCRRRNADGSWTSYSPCSSCANECYQGGTVQTW